MSPVDLLLSGPVITTYTIVGWRENQRRWVFAPVGGPPRRVGR
jgi:hypothetical protein